jgi:hypothetical protein
MPWTAESARLAGLKSAAKRLANRLSGGTEPPTASEKKDDVAAAEPTPPAERHNIRIRQSNDPPVSTHDKWTRMPLDAAIENLERLTRERDVAAAIITDRLHRERQPTLRCIICERPISLPHGWNFKDDGHRNPQTGMIEPAYTDTTRCYELYVRKRQAERNK